MHGRWSGRTDGRAGGAKEGTVVGRGKEGSGFELPECSFSQQFRLPGEGGREEGGLLTTGVRRMTDC